LRAALVLRGEGDLAPIARRLHAHALGSSRPFIVCKSTDDGLASLQAAEHGTLCIDDRAQDLLGLGIRHVVLDQDRADRVAPAEPLEPRPGLPALRARGGRNRAALLR
jgi:hypothetical protein